MQTLEYRRPERQKTSRSAISRMLLYVWLPLSLIAMGAGVVLCLNYNSSAGTDLLKREIVFIALSMNTGPFVGPLQGRDMTNSFYRMLIPVGIAGLAVPWLPMISIRWPRKTHWQVALILLHVAGGIFWFLCAFASLGYHLS